MRMDVFPIENWDRTNTAVSALWGLGEGQSLLAHPGLAAALREVVLGFAQIYSHKRSIAIIKGNSWGVDFMAPWFLREAYTVQSAGLAELQAGSEAWVQSLKKDTAFVLFAEDHPMTAQTWDWDRLDRLLNENKIFSIRISHHAFVSERAELRPLSCRLCSIDESLSLSVSGERFRIAADVAPYSAWDPQEAVRRVSERLRVPVDEKAVLDFEREFAAERLLPEGTPRHFDRALLSFKDVGADALVDRLRAEGVPAAEISSFHLCSWDSVRLYKNWWKDAPGAEELRGAVSISPSLLKTKDFAKRLRAAYEGLRSRQSW